MENQELPKENQLAIYDKKLATLTNNEVADILVIANISKPNNFNSLTKEEWKWLVTEIKKDFGNKLTQEELMQVISSGVKGMYDKTQFTINGFTIYRWIRTFLETRPKKELPCPENIERFYWNQMSEREQIQWLEKNKKTQEN
jgi:hypothetical protein